MNPPNTNQMQMSIQPLEPRVFGMLMASMLKMLTQSYVTPYCNYYNIGDLLSNYKQI